MLKSHDVITLISGSSPGSLSDCCCGCAGQWRAWLDAAAGCTVFFPLFDDSLRVFLRVCLRDYVSHSRGHFQGFGLHTEPCRMQNELIRCVVKFKVPEVGITRMRAARARAWEAREAEGIPRPRDSQKHIYM